MQLEVPAHEIRGHLKLTVPESLLQQAHEALNDPQLLAMLGRILKSKKVNHDLVLHRPPRDQSRVHHQTNVSGPYISHNSRKPVCSAWCYH